MTPHALGTILNIRLFIPELRPYDRREDHNVQSSYSGGITRTIGNVSLAYFADYEGVSDSIRDLCSAGFQARDINISQPVTDRTAHRNTETDGLIPNAVGAHSRQWLWRRYREHDRHRKGADQMSGLNPVPLEGENPTCTSFDLQIVLGAMRVPQVVIALLLQDVQRKGIYLMVDADRRVQEADAILDRNAGCLRTQYLR